MEQRFEKQAETGGDNEQLHDEKLTWSERFWKRLRRRHEAREQHTDTQETAEKRMSFFEFVRDIFRDEDEVSKPGSTERSFIDDAWDEYEASKGEGAQPPEAEVTPTQEERLAELPEQERTEFYMVVAQRFKDAGNRFIGVIRHRFQSGAENSDEYMAAREAARIHSVEAMYADEVADAAEAEPAPTAPPFDFAVQSKSNQIEHPAKPQRPPVIDDFDYRPRNPESPNRQPNVRFEGDTTIVEYHPRFRDILFAGGIGYGIGRRRGRIKAERAHEKQIKRHIEAHEKELKELDDQRSREMLEHEHELAVGVRTEREHQQQLREAAVRKIQVEAKQAEIASSASASGLHTEKTRSATESLQEVQRAAEALLFTASQAHVSDEAPNDTPHQQERYLAEEGVYELEYRNLKPANTKKNTKSQTAERTAPEVSEPQLPFIPDGVMARVVPSEQLRAPMRQESHVVNPAAHQPEATTPKFDNPERLDVSTRVSSDGRTASVSRNAAHEQDAASVAQILSQKQASLHAQDTPRLVTSSKPTGDSSIIVTVLVAAVALIVGLLFISAL